MGYRDISEPYLPQASGYSGARGQGGTWPAQARRNQANLSGFDALLESAGVEASGNPGGWAATDDGLLSPDHRRQCGRISSVGANLVILWLRNFRCYEEYQYEAL